MIVVYTCITNQKDKMVYMKKEPGVEYVCFSDYRFDHPTWTYKPIELLGQQDPRRVARRYKILSHVYFPGYDTIWLDGRVKLNYKPSEIFEKYNSDFAVRSHLQRSCIYQEGDQVKKQEYEVESIVDDQLQRYRDESYPPLNGLHETGILMRRNTIDVAVFNSYWFSQVASGSKRDQLSFDYTRWKLGFEIEELDRSDISIARHRVPTNVNR